MRKKLWKRSAWGLLLFFLLLNTIVFFHAWKFTHFNIADTGKTAPSSQLSFTEKLKILFLGIQHPKPTGKAIPKQPYENISLQSNKKIACWLIKNPAPKGTIILFHGYGGEKSSLLDKSDIFQSLGYNTMLVDFMGCGDSEGVQTTIGYKEAANVKTCYDYLVEKGEQNIYLFGTSMGAAAILRALAIENLHPAGIIIECPFGTMYKTVATRFKTMGVPSFPLAGMLVFWGGIQNGYWAFDHNPEQYALSVQCPVLLMYGEKDKKVSKKEIDIIFANLQGKKQLALYPGAGHENYLIRHKQQWTADICNFLEQPVAAH